MKRRRFLSLALALMLIISLCACKTKVVDDSTDATHGNAPVTGREARRDNGCAADHKSSADDKSTREHNFGAAQNGERQARPEHRNVHRALPAAEDKAERNRSAEYARTFNSDGRIQLRRIQKRRSASTRQTRRNISTRRASTPSR